VQDDAAHRSSDVTSPKAAKIKPSGPGHGFVQQRQGSCP